MAPRLYAIIHIYTHTTIRFIRINRQHARWHRPPFPPPFPFLLISLFHPSILINPFMHVHSSKSPATHPAPPPLPLFCVFPLYWTFPACLLVCMVTRVCGAAAAAQVGNIHHGAGRDGQVPGPRAAQGASAPLLRLVPGPQHNVQYPGLEPLKVPGPLCLG